MSIDPTFTTLAALEAWAARMERHAADDIACGYDDLAISSEKKLARVRASHSHLYLTQEAPLE